MEYIIIAAITLTLMIIIQIIAKSLFKFLYLFKMVNLNLLLAQISLLIKNT